MTDKDPTALLEQADGEPRWLAEALKGIFERLPPIPPSAPPKTEELPSWDSSLLAKLQVDASRVPLRAWDRISLADWLRMLAHELEQNREVTTYLWTLQRSEPPSGRRAK